MSRRDRLVCTPGTLCDHRVFDPLVERLGFDAVHAPIRAPNVEEAAHAALMAAPDHFVAMGFSLGGLVVLEMLRQAPERIDAAILISSNAHPDAPENAPGRRAQVDTARREGMAVLIDELWPRYVAASALGQMDICRTIKAMAVAIGVEDFAQQAELAITRADSRADIPRMKAPLLVLCGAEDALCSTDRYAEAAAGPTATLVVLPGVGHFVPLEATARAADAIQGWMDTVSMAHPNAGRA